jgi:DNA repair exonuclease SbcCD ATPase subunit
MTLQEQIAADLTAVNEAQAALDAANAKLVADKDALAAVQPHLSILDQIEAELAKVEDGVVAELQSSLDAVKAQITPLIAQMRALFNA